RVGPARLPRPRARRGLHRAAVARGLQLRLPPVPPAPRPQRAPRRPRRAAPPSPPRRSLLAMREATAPGAGDPPPVPELHGFAFTEIAADPTSGTAVAPAPGAPRVRGTRAQRQQTGAL